MVESLNPDTGEWQNVDGRPPAPQFRDEADTLQESEALDESRQQRINADLAGEDAAFMVGDTPPELVHEAGDHPHDALGDMLVVFEEARQRAGDARKREKALILRLKRLADEKALLEVEIERAAAEITLRDNDVNALAGALMLAFENFVNARQAPPEGRPNA